MAALLLLPWSVQALPPGQMVELSSDVKIYKGSTLLYSKVTSGSYNPVATAFQNAYSGDVWWPYRDAVVALLPEIPEPYDGEYAAASMTGPLSLTMTPQGGGKVGLALSVPDLYAYYSGDMGGVPFTDWEARIYGDDIRASGYFDYATGSAWLSSVSYQTDVDIDGELLFDLSISFIDIILSMKSDYSSVEDLALSMIDQMFDDLISDYTAAAVWTTSGLPQQIPTGKVWDGSVDVGATVLNALAALPNGGAVTFSYTNGSDVYTTRFTVGQYAVSFANRVKWVPCTPGSDPDCIPT